MKLSLTHYREVLVTYLRPQRANVCVLAALLFGGIGMQLLAPQVLRRFIDSALAGSPTELLVQLALIFLAISIARYMLTLGTTYTSELVGWAATNGLRSNLAAHCLRLDMSFHNQHTPGELIERVDGDVSKLATFFSELVIRALGSLLLLTGVLIVLFFEDWRIGLAFTLFAAIALIILANMRDIATPHMRAERQASAELFGFLEERIAGTEDIRANGGAAYTLQKLIEKSRNVWRNDLTAGLRIATLRTTIIVFFWVGSILSLALGAYLFQNGAITIGTVYLIFAYVQMLGQPIERLALEAQNLQQASASILRVTELYHTQSAIHDGTRARLPDTGALAVEFHNVSFSYANTGDQGSGSGEQGAEDRASQFSPHQGMLDSSPVSSFAISNLAFQLEPGTTLGLLGRTGSGKTSLTRLLLRLYDVTNGAVLLNGADIRDLPLADLRRQIGIVTQEVQLFNASVRDNLTLFDPAISDTHILRVIETLGLLEWYNTLAHGLDTVLDSGGSGLSAGEAQLLAFTRVFLRDPGLVILDEASSRLDPATEQLIERAIDRLMEGRTGIIIAHRLSTVERVDAIMVLEAGRIAEFGPRELLAANPNSRFARLRQAGMGDLLA